MGTPHAVFADLLCNGMPDLLRKGIGTEQFRHVPCGVTLIQLLHLCTGRSGKCRMGADHFPLSAGSVTVQIHNIRCRLHQLSRPACQQHMGKAQFFCTVQQIAQIIAAKHNGFSLRILPLQK